MNGAIALPCPSTMSAPKNSITKMMGKSQNFFRTRKNCQSSFKILIFVPFKTDFSYLWAEFHGF